MAFAVNLCGFESFFFIVIAMCDPVQNVETIHGQVLICSFPGFT